MATEVLKTIGRRPDADGVVPGYVRKYRTFNTISGESDVRELRFRDRLHFLESLNHWNRHGEGYWVYWED